MFQTNKTTYRTTRICAGLYVVSDGQNNVQVSNNEFGWMASAEWDRFLYSDATDTKREAKATAVAMLNDFRKNGFMIVAA